MKKTISTLLLMLMAVISYAIAYTPETLPVDVKYHNRSDFNGVVNPDNLLSAEEVQAINDTLWSLRQHQHVQGLVIAINESDPEDAYDFCIEVGRKYGVGGKQSLGFVMLVTAKQRHYQIITGKGFDKYLTDAHCSTIGRKYMAPNFKEGKWGEGLIQAVTVISAVCNGDAELQEELNDDNDGISLWSILGWIGGFIALVWGFIEYGSRKWHECPKCKKHHYDIFKRVVSYPEGTFDSPEEEQKYTQQLTEYHNQFLTEENGKHKLDVSSIDNTFWKPVNVTDYYRCPDCGYEGTREKMGSNREFFIGTFTGAAGLLWGEIVAKSLAAIDTSDDSDYDSSDSDSSYDTYGGGDFDGGGAGGDF